MSLGYTRARGGGLYGGGRDAHAILHQELLRRPKHKATVSANWQASDALSVNASVLYVGSWVDGNRDFSIPRLRAPG